MMNDDALVSTQTDPPLMGIVVTSRGFLHPDTPGGNVHQLSYSQEVDQSHPLHVATLNNNDNDHGHLVFAFNPQADAEKSLEVIWPDIFKVNENADFSVSVRPLVREHLPEDDRDFVRALHDPYVLSATTEAITYKSSLFKKDELFAVVPRSESSASSLDDLQLSSIILENYEDNARRQLKSFEDSLPPFSCDEGTIIYREGQATPEELTEGRHTPDKHSNEPVILVRRGRENPDYDHKDYVGDWYVETYVPSGDNSYVLTNRVIYADSQQVQEGPRAEQVDYADLPPSAKVMPTQAMLNELKPLYEESQTGSPEESKALFNDKVMIWYFASLVESFTEPAQGRMQEFQERQLIAEQLYNFIQGEYTSPVKANDARFNDLNEEQKEAALRNIPLTASTHGRHGDINVEEAIKLVNQAIDAGYEIEFHDKEGNKLVIDNDNDPATYLPWTDEGFQKDLRAVVRKIDVEHNIILKPLEDNPQNPTYQYNPAQNKFMKPEAGRE